jgi:SAM-dependent methyltransferase
MSHEYLRSPTHAGDADLDILLELLAPERVMCVLDVASGAGHTAVRVAPRVASVVAIDIAPEMIERTLDLARDRQVTNLTGYVMDVEALDWPDGSFDAVTCRIAPHHFTNIWRALAEIERVLVPGGRFVVEDSAVPDDGSLATFLNDVERLRDPTHRQSYGERDWRAMLSEAGLTVRQVAWFRKAHEIDDWLRTAGIGSREAAAVRDAFRAAPAEAVSYFEIDFDGDGVPVRYVDDKILIRADRPGRL